jgi:hypothetical protein
LKASSNSTLSLGGTGNAVFAGARMPEHTFGQPVPVVEEHIETVALGWSGQAVYVRLPDPRCRTNSIWLDGADVKRR